MIPGHKIEAMHRYYGVDKQGRKCKDCPHFISTMPTDRRYFKCLVYGKSCGESSDWRAKYLACSLIDQPFPTSDMRIKDRLKHESRGKVIEQLKGQISMEDLI